MRAIDPQLRQANQAADDVLGPIDAALAAAPLTVDPALLWVESHPSEIARHRGETLVIDPGRGIVVVAPTLAEAYAEADRLGLGDEALLIRVPELPPGP